MAAGLVIVPVVSLITPKPDREKVDRIFTCYEETVTVTRKYALEEDEEA